MKIPSGKILVIDDEESLRSTLSRILVREGFQVTTAADGFEALRRFSSLSFDLVILDLRLPDMDGIQVLREIRKINQQLPVILLTGHGTMSSALDAFHLEATDFLLKPVKPDDLLRRAKDILNRQFVVRRKREIQAQIETLQDELHRLDIGEIEQRVVSAVSQDARTISKGLLTIDLQSRRASFGNKKLSLPPTAFDYLVVLAGHSPDILGYQQIVAEAQGFQVDLREAKELSKWHISILRKELEISPANPQYILNVRGKGYHLILN